MNIHDYKRGLASITERGGRKCFGEKGSGERRIFVLGKLDSASMENDRRINLRRGITQGGEYL